MFCKSCGKEVNDKAIACPNCGVSPLIEKKFCNGCGVETTPNQAICIKCGISLGTSSFDTNEFIGKITDVPIYVARIVNIVAWVIFIGTGNPILEFVMAVACVYAFLIAKRHQQKRLMYVSIGDAVWMLCWAIGLFGHFRGF